jgi:hypothetical protein
MSCGVELKKRRKSDPSRYCQNPASTCGVPTHQDKQKKKRDASTLQLPIAAESIEQAEHVWRSFSTLCLSILEESENDPFR